MGSQTRIEKAFPAPWRALLAALAAGLVIGGCGSSAGSSLGRNASLVLDFTPNAVHAGIYSALAHHYDRDTGVHLSVIVPQASTDSIGLLESRRVDFAILDLHDLAIARERGSNIVAVMAIVQRPLASLIAVPSVRSPRQLAGRTVGITGVPSDTAVLDSIVAGAGGDPRAVRTIAIGFSAVPVLLAGRVAAATAFWNDEGLTLSLRRPSFHVFRVDEFGAPTYPELVVCTSRGFLTDHPSLVGAVVRTLVYGYDFTISNPHRSAADLESFVPSLDPRLVAAQVSALLPAFVARDGRVGELQSAALRAWARWETRFHIVSHAPDVGKLFDSSFAAAAASPLGAN
ncbi:MAG: ABC transporter substrate-binding protein [Actinomycetota bacterium]|nr:ABC transporter substrate-binding protein [Actinomycetota bacterium]